MLDLHFISSVQSHNIRKVVRAQHEKVRVLCCCCVVVLLLCLCVCVDVLCLCVLNLHSCIHRAITSHTKCCARSARRLSLLPSFIFTPSVSHTLQSLCSRIVVYLRSLCNCFAVALRLLCNRFAIALLSLCSRFAIALQWLYNCFAVAL
jgi:hypothetical protein